ncbi:MAG: STAS domain-containing protein [Actinomycetota bacterium]|nr:STAS domain-containing protein [Actinomycetota bacterium]
MKNSARIRVHEPDRTGILVELFGEFDIETKRALRETVGSVARWGRPVFLNLSGVTFLDSACLWELAVQHKLHANHLALCDPSYEVELSVAACNLEGWIDFRPNKDSASRPRTRRPARPAPDEEPRCRRGRGR